MTLDSPAISKEYIPISQDLVPKIQEGKLAFECPLFKLPVPYKKMIRYFAYNHADHHFNGDMNHQAKISIREDLYFKQGTCRMPKVKFLEDQAMSVYLHNNLALFGGKLENRCEVSRRFGIISELRMPKEYESTDPVFVYTKPARMHYERAGSAIIGHKDLRIVAGGYHYSDSDEKVMLGSCE